MLLISDVKEPLMIFFFKVEKIRGFFSITNAHYIHMHIICVRMHMLKFKWPKYQPSYLNRNQFCFFFLFKACVVMVVGVMGKGVAMLKFMRND